MAVGTVKWFTRKSRSNPGATDSLRALIRIPDRSQQHVALRDRIESTYSGAEAGRAELRCAGCGYGIVVSGSVPPCPMCRANDWEPQAAE
jgi:hypothetical protein